jgi:hypothetical protein
MVFSYSRLFDYRFVFDENLAYYWIISRLIIWR